MSRQQNFRTIRQMREDALAIWHAGVAAVRSDELVRQHVNVENEILRVNDLEVYLPHVDRIIVVGAGKAGAGMAAGLENALGEDLLREKKVAGWINVPDDCSGSLQAIKLHAARPAGVNEPTANGIHGAKEILRLVQSATVQDLCFCLLSGGASALLPIPVEGISLTDKQQVTRFLSAAGANIQQLNTVRKQLSRIKGGRLAQACGAGHLVSLIISDVLGDSLDVIASGPTVANTTTAKDALDVLEQFAVRSAGLPAAIFDVLQRQANENNSPNALRPSDFSSRVTNSVIGNNAMAVDAAGAEAERRGYSHAMHAVTKQESSAEEVGRHLARMARRMRDEPGPDCLITGGEPVVQLADTAVRGKGGRNQQLVLAAMLELNQTPAPEGDAFDGILLLSGGTDGEDGPTDAAGVRVDADVAKAARQRQLNAADYLRRNDAYHFFDPLDALIKTGPTHTNVCDLRIALVDRVETPGSRAGARVNPAKAN